MIKTTSEKLRRLVSDHETIVAIYTSLTCEQCIKLLPKFNKVVSNKVYDHILFVEIDVSENSMIEKEIEKKHTPYLSVYCKGIMCKDASVKNEEEFKELLHSLL